MPLLQTLQARPSVCRSPRHLKAIIGVAMWWYCAAAAAGSEDPGARMFSFNGFGTLGVVHSSEDKADFASSVLQPNGAGYSRPWSSDVDSRIGAQLTANLISRLSAVVQVVAEQNADNTYRPHVEWANIKYQFTPDFDVRIGRVLLPTFMVSDSRKVNYANPWVRPPTEVYSQSPITYTDGVDASFRLHLGELTNTLQANYGRNQRFQLPAGNSFKTKTAWGIFDNAEVGPALFHVGYVYANFTVEPEIELFEVFRQFGPQGAAIADQYDLIDKSVRILTIGASYDPGQWFAMGEWVRIKSDSFIGRTTAWYISGGYRAGKFTPFLTVAQVTEGITSAPGLALSGLPPSLARIAVALNGGLNQVLALRPVQYTSSVGVRWDFMKSVDLKLQFDRTRLGAGSPGTLINLQPGFQPGGSVHLFSATVDFVF